MPPSRMVMMMSEPDDERIRLLMRTALDEAFKLQIASLYKVWLSNPADLDAAQKRAAVGAANAIEVYRVAVTAIDNWEE
jgi:hypothetical protein